jgi:hypothetical protein
MPKKIKRAKKRASRIAVRVPPPFKITPRTPITDRPAPVRDRSNRKQSEAAANLADTNGGTNSTLPSSTGGTNSTLPSSTEHGVRATQEVPKKVAAADLLTKLKEDPDFINSKRFDFSIKKMQDRYPTGCPERVAASCLMMDEKEFQEFHAKIVAKLQFYMNVKPE